VENELGMAMREAGPEAEEVRTRIRELRQEIENLLKLDREQRLSRQSQVPWDVQKQHETRVARMDEIKEELVNLGRSLK
jgi:ribosome recycling factor